MNSLHILLCTSLTVGILMINARYRLLFFFLVKSFIFLFYEHKGTLSLMIASFSQIHLAQRSLAFSLFFLYFWNLES